LDSQTLCRHLDLVIVATSLSSLPPALLLSPTYRTSAEASAPLTHDLVASLASVGIDDDTISEGHESEVILL